MSNFNSHLMSLKLKNPGENSLSQNASKEAPSKTVLELIREQGISPHVGCQEGFCGACRCKIKSGSVEHSDDTLAWRNDDEIIPCTARLVSDEIEIEVSP